MTIPFTFMAGISAPVNSNQEDQLTWSMQVISALSARVQALEADVEDLKLRITQE